MTGTEIFKRSLQYERGTETIRLHAPQWKLLLAFDGQRSLAEVALSVETAFSEALPLTENFLAHGWIEEQPITLDQYLKRMGAASTSTIGSAVTPPVVLHEAKAEKPSVPAPVAVPTPPPPPVPTSSAPRIVPTPPPPTPTRPTSPPPLKAPLFSAPVIATAPAAAAVPPPPPAPVTRARGPMHLKAVVDYIVSQVGNNSLGQLVVYRIFLRVPPQLLQAEDIASVHLVNDQSVVKTEALKEAIASAVVEVLKRSLPESVFAGA